MEVHMVVHIEVHMEVHIEVHMEVHMAVHVAVQGLVNIDRVTEIGGEDATDGEERTWLNAIKHIYIYMTWLMT